ncbi:helix-turn-helix transcriptional regulator [Streptomyces sp. RTGN2]|uniref:helix-turn-helix domain-containing protein n=1 Tax=Streptomyces sp. RTGN2 TaxID=3016525 RepID=UPI00255535DF|nr:helix-turn-helix transcriptional regulator [Streptomyces sp. RTGN2]
MPDTPLGAFLRARRRRLAPGDAGLPAGSRRRTPGLRREEVAARAGISADYYARLEQGRQRVPTVSVLDGLAEALLLADAERVYLHRLAGLGARDTQQVPAARPRPAVSVNTRVLLEALHETPAFVVDRRFDLIAWNPMASALLGGLDTRPAHQVNLLWQVFCCPFGERTPANREAVDSIGADLVAGLRAHHADCPNDRGLDDLVVRLSAASPVFAALWEQHRAGMRSEGFLEILHPELRAESFPYTTLALPEPDQHLFVFLAPAGSHARDVFRNLLPRSRTLAPGRY